MHDKCEDLQVNVIVVDAMNVTRFVLLFTAASTYRDFTEESVWIGLIIYVF